MVHPAPPCLCSRLLRRLVPVLLPLLGSAAGPLALAAVAPPALAAPGALVPLPFTQSQAQPLLRSRYELLIPPAALPPGTTSLRLTLPPRFDGRVLPESLRLCRMVTRPAVATTRCAAVIPSRLETTAPGVLRLVPEHPLAPEVLHGLSLVLFNPSLDGTYPLRLWADPAGRAVGAWLLPIETDSD